MSHHGSALAEPAKIAAKRANLNGGQDKRFRGVRGKTVPTGAGRLRAWLNLAPHLRLRRPCRPAPYDNDVEELSHNLMRNGCTL
jgi:hypothetical protein